MSKHLESTNYTSSMKLHRRKLYSSRYQMSLENRNTNEIMKLQSELKSNKSVFSSFNDVVEELQKKLTNVITTGNKYSDEKASQLSQQLMAIKKSMEQSITSSAHSVESKSAAAAQKVVEVQSQVQNLSHQVNQLCGCNSKNVQSLSVAQNSAEQAKSLANQALQSVQSVSQQVSQSATKSELTQAQNSAKNAQNLAKQALQLAQSAVSKAQNIESKAEVKTMQLGPKFNLPQQPEVVLEGGVHKVAPLALTVNGGVVLHDIGYTTDKAGLVPVLLDPVTGRLVQYRGK